MIMKCPACFCEEIDDYLIGYTFFTHYNFSDIKPSGHIGKCGRCGTIFQMTSLNDNQTILGLFESQEYAVSRQTSHQVKAREFEKAVTRSALQAELLCAYISMVTKPSILDVGCFDGRLLVEFDKRIASANLHGFDINPHLDSLFPKQSNFHFHTSNLASIEKQFDLICLSHSIMYHQDLNILMQQLKRLIKSSGILMIQVPDIAKNPCYLLMGDQYYYFTPNSLKNILKFFGFHFTLLDNPWFPREIMGVAKPVLNGTPDRFHDDHSLLLYIEQLEKMSRCLDILADEARTGVLGTTVNSAFIDSWLGDRVEFFTDENKERIGTRFRDKKVIDPADLSDTDLTIIPYGESGHFIKERFENNFKGQFLAI